MASRFVLASASPRRLELLRALGLEPVVRTPAIDEDGRPGESPTDRVLRLAATKGRAVARGLDPAGGERVVLAADTAVVLDGDALGKPADEDEAVGMLRRLRGRTHEVRSGVFLMRADDGRAVSRVETTRVRFRDFPDSLIRWYVSTGEPMDKAGAYGIQGRGALLAEGLDGSWSNVVGLPLERIPEMLESLGLSILDFMAPTGP